MIFSRRDLTMDKEINGTHWRKDLILGFAVFLTWLALAIAPARALVEIDIMGESIIQRIIKA